MSKAILRTAMAGTAESCDALVTVTPQTAGQGFELELDSSVKKQYGKQIAALAEKIAKEAGYSDVKMHINDKGAWEYTLTARIKAALIRGGAQ